MEYMKLDSLLAKPGTPLWRAFNSQWLGNENMDAFGELFVNNWNTRRVDMAPLYFGIFKDPHKESSVAHSIRLRKRIDKYLDDNHRDKEWSWFHRHEPRWQPLDLACLRRKHPTLHMIESYIFVHIVHSNPNPFFTPLHLIPSVMYQPDLYM